MIYQFNQRKPHTNTHLPRGIIPDEETFEIDQETPSEHMLRGQNYFSNSVRRTPDWAESVTDLYRLRLVAPGILDAYQHLHGSDRLKNTPRGRISGPVDEFNLWDNAPLHRLAFLYGHRFWPGLAVVAEALDMPVMLEETSLWMVGSFLPRADATAAQHRQLERAHTRTASMAHLLLPLMDEYRLQYVEVIRRVIDAWPEYAGQLLDRQVETLLDMH